MTNATIPPADPPHRCPGGCRRYVPHRMVACNTCWSLLPPGPAARDHRASGRDRLRIVGEAIGWYRENVRAGQLISEAGKPDLEHHEAVPHD